jgi:hypothetical protein
MHLLEEFHKKKNTDMNILLKKSKNHLDFKI